MSQITITKREKEEEKQHKKRNEVLRSNIEDDKSIATTIFSSIDLSSLRK